MEKRTIDFKLSLACKLIGLNEDWRKTINEHNLSSAVLYHVEGVLGDFEVKPLEARKILVEMKAALHPDYQKVIIPEIADYLTLLNETWQEIEQKSPAIEDSVTRVSAQNAPPAVDVNNPYPTVFAGHDLRALSLFVALRQIIGDGPSAHGFIFNEMRDFSLIVPGMTVTGYLVFLQENFGIKINRDGLESRPTQKKRRTFKFHYDQLRLSEITGKDYTRE